MLFHKHIFPCHSLCSPFFLPGSTARLTWSFACLECFLMEVLLPCLCLSTFPSSVYLKRRKMGLVKVSCPKVVPELTPPAWTLESKMQKNNFFSVPGLLVIGWCERCGLQQLGGIFSLMHEKLGSRLTVCPNWGGGEFASYFKLFAAGQTLL